MSIALIQESAKEVRRLAIAGSALAVGDFRLKKLIAPLEAAGAKVPVFAQVAKAVSDVVIGSESDSAANLLKASTLLNAILYTQGQTGTDGDFVELETYDSACSSTKTSARTLKPLVQALTSTGGGRFEIVKSAVERGAFHDLRLIDPAIRALGDAYPELADLVATKILPGYGPGIVPRLKDGLDLKGKKQDARRLQVMHQLDPNGTIDLCKTALDDGSPEVKAAAISCLGKHEDCLPLVQEQVTAKNKLVRAAALDALAEHDEPAVTRLFIDLVRGKTLDILAGPFRKLRNRQVLDALLKEGRQVFDLMIKGDSEQIPRFLEILRCLEGRSEQPVEEFLIRCLEQAESIGKLKATQTSHVGGEDVVLRLSGLLYRHGTPKAFEAVLAKRDVLPSVAFEFVLRAALRVWSEDEVFKAFSSLLDQNNGAGKEMRALLEQHISAATWGDDSRFRPMYFDGDSDPSDAQLVNNTKWDPRWLDAAIKADRRTIVCCLARPDHKGALKYLLDVGDAKKTSDLGLYIRALARCRYEKATDVFLDLVGKRTKGARYVDYELQFLFENARYLPPADLPKLDTFAATLDEKFTDKFLEALEPLRAPKQTH